MGASRVHVLSEPLSEPENQSQDSPGKAAASVNSTTWVHFISDFLPVSFLPYILFVDALWSCSCLHLQCLQNPHCHQKIHMTLIGML
jgi:hypothetical protein